LRASPDRRLKRRSTKNAMATRYAARASAPTLRL
jgi:hypothetical protein